MAENRALIVIPARMASTRLPGKPLIDIAGTAMIVHVLRRAEAAAVGPVVVATDSEAITACVEKAGGRAVMTSVHHVCGSDRVFEALAAVDPAREYGIIVNLQGDLPTLPPADISAVIATLADLDVEIATLAAEISRADERTNPNVVKVVGTPTGQQRLRALYFTRATAPSPSRASSKTCPSANPWPPSAWSAPPSWSTSSAPWSSTPSAATAAAASPTHGSAPSSVLDPAPAIVCAR